MDKSIRILCTVKLAGHHMIYNKKTIIVSLSSALVYNMIKCNE